MASFFCENEECHKEFWSPHSGARYCSRPCAGKASMRRPEIRLRQSINMRKYTDDYLLEEIRKAAKRLGRSPLAKELTRGRASYVARFGNFRNAVISAGLVPYRGSNQYRYPPKRMSMKSGLGVVASKPVPAARELTVVDPNASCRPAVSVSLRFQVLERDKFRCRYCGRTPQMGYTLCVDHVVPVSKGGPTTLENLAAACEDCNMGKSDQLLRE
jgi:hypothetical protein